MKRHLCLIAAILSFHLALSAPVSAEHLPKSMEGLNIRSYSGIGTSTSFLPNNEILSSFNAFFINGEVRFEWKILGASDESSSIRYFVIERMERDDFFLAVAGVKVGKASTGVGDYSIHDVQPPEKPLIRYRLKVVMTDGTLVYSKIQTVYTNFASSLLVSHHPEKSQLSILLKEKRSTPFELSLYNLMGKRVYNATIDVEPQVYLEKEISTASLPTGIYILNLTNNSDAWQAKIFKK